MQNKVEFVNEEDCHLHNILDSSLLQKNGKPYEIYSPFKKHCWDNLNVRKVDEFNLFRWGKCDELDKLTFKDLNSLFVQNPNLKVRGSRKYALEKLRQIKDQKH